MSASAETARQPWTVLLRPRWLAWHAFTVLAIAGMCYLGDWQLRRALSGNQLSWAYTFEWPLFAAFAGYFWVKSLREELRGDGSDPHESAESAVDALRGGPWQADLAAAGSSAAAPGSDSTSDEARASAEAAHRERLIAEVRAHRKRHSRG